MLADQKFILKARNLPKLSCEQTNTHPDMMVIIKRLIGIMKMEDAICKDLKVYSDYTQSN